MSNRLYYGDNLPVLRGEIADASVDLVYLDPPFNSNATYNLLFRAPTGQKSEAQIEAFEDSWHWAEPAARAYDEVLHAPYTDAATMLHALRRFLGENDMTAYLAMMAVRLLELHRVLKPTGSLYLHCDPTASHYIKLLLDAVFGKFRFRNDIVWKRTATHSDSRTWSRVSDNIERRQVRPAVARAAQYDARHHQPRAGISRRADPRAGGLSGAPAVIAAAPPRANPVMATWGRRRAR